MRIVHTEASLVLGGQERRVLAESMGMRERGHEVWIVTPRRGALGERARDLGISLRYLGFEKALLPLNAARLSGILRRLRPDVVNTHSSQDSWTAVAARRLAGFPGALVRTRHTAAGVRPGPLHRVLYGEPDHVITTGERLRAWFARDRLVRMEDSTSIPTGIDLERFRSEPGSRAPAREGLELPASAPVVGIVAFLRPEKGHRVLLRAMPDLVRRWPNLVLLVVGEGRERSALESLTAELGLGGAVRFLGMRDDVPRVLAALDVFTLPSTRNEGLAQAVVQAMAMGLPVVATDVGAVPEAVLDGESGFVVPPGDVPSLADRLGTLLADARLRQAMGERGSRHARELFSLDRMLDRTEEAYRKALSSRDASSEPDRGRSGRAGAGGHDGR